MISAWDRQSAMSLIQEATEAGAREELACKELGITQRTLQQWRCNGIHSEDQLPHAKRQSPSNKLSELERQQIVDTIHQPEFAAQSDCSTPCGPR
ncbi:hypothetical protein [Paenibacillus sp. OSY-SE]|uniref:hypothetical protein n=1 Tax=Paenibacillus sp. OSY-SE TaxID=1196323 RepID=UPI000474E7DC|nr:hypothetical protein [Paenibacillus sp. OSY-SE]